MRVTLSVLLILFCTAAFCQQNDTLVYAQGKIVNGLTKEPVVARISYQSLPYGSRIGFVSGSTYSFPMFDNDKYSITVEAAGFAPSKYLIDPKEANPDRRVIQDIELSLPTSAINHAEETHTVGKVMRLENLIFQTGSAKIAPSSHTELDEVVRMLSKNPRMVIQLEGHTDYVGDAKLNLRLSEARVGAVKEYLVSNGVSKSRVKTKAFGGTLPLSRENTEAARSLNRRVEVRVLEN
jgi:outer membrane protein OmpA-like peptidoglycan-associated protein